jgi:hypothetical protein
MRKNSQYIVQMPTPEIILDIGATIQTFALSSAGSTPNRDKDKYLWMTSRTTPCTLMYVKDKT